jgi:DNA primase
MGFPPSFLDDLRSRLSLNELAGRHIELRRHGTESKGLCPFHNEKTPSFTINEAKGFFHCFGCEAHGDIFGFIMQLESLSFVEAVEHLANECGIPLPSWSPDDSAVRTRRRTLMNINELATSWFEDRLRGPEGKSARRYLVDRGLDAVAARYFRLGFAPNSRNSLVNYMAEKRVDRSVLRDSGLVKHPDGTRSAYDFFRGRIIFPIIDRRKQVVGFGGRTLGPGGPKYINSPETDLFRKGLTLYNECNAADTKDKPSTVIVGEGYMDVIALHRAGFPRSVAPLGTALTNEQIALLWRLAPEPLLCFDGDVAGGNAAFRAAMRTLPLLKAGHSLSFVFLPSGHDPDSLVSLDGGDQLITLIKKPVTLVDFIWVQISTRQPVDTPERRAALRQQLKKVVLSITDKAVQQGYAAEFKRRINALFSAAPNSSGRYKTRDSWFSSALLRNHTRGTARTGDPHHRERVLVATLIGHPELIKYVREEFIKTPIRSQELQSLKESLLNVWDQDPSIDYSAARTELTKKGHGDTIALLFDRTGWNQTITEPSIQPDSDGETALVAWRETLAIHEEETT